MRFYAFTTIGLEELTSREIARRLDSATSSPTSRGIVHFEYGGDAARLLRLRTTEDVFALVGSGTISRERDGLRQAEALVMRRDRFDAAVAVLRGLRRSRAHRITYRVVCQRVHDAHAYRRVDLQTRIGAAIGSRFPRWREVEDDAHIEVWARQDGDELLCGVRLSDRTMRHRSYKSAHVEASLRPVVARCMVHLSEPSPDDVFLDPMCGAGTILIERGDDARYRLLIGGDHAASAVAATRANVGPRFQPIGLHQWDAGALPLGSGSVSALVTNLPFGIKVGSEESNAALYPAFLREAARVLAPEGRMILLTSRSRLLERALEGTSVWKLRRRWQIELLGRRAAIYEVRHAI
ncbi:methyltransferase [Candidatus Poribacteria bacterium]|nr:methyltransferase [Candidatus Poribacteria bacterium]